MFPTTVMWLCPQHAKCLDDWNKSVIREPSDLYSAALRAKREVVKEMTDLQRFGPAPAK